MRFIATTLFLLVAAIGSNGFVFPTRMHPRSKLSAKAEKKDRTPPTEDEAAKACALVIDDDG